MNPQIREFFDRERSRGMAPDERFTARVMARLGDVRKSGDSLWDGVLGAVRPVLAFTMVLLLAFLAVHIFTPPPVQVMSDVYLQLFEELAAERFLYTDAEIPQNGELFEYLVAFEGGQ